MAVYCSLGAISLPRRELNLGPILLNRREFDTYQFNDIEGESLVEGSPSSGTSLVALDRYSAYIFVDGESVIHEYRIPDDSDILNCGGYLDKLAKYRSSEFSDSLESVGISKDGFSSSSLPILGSRSALIDLDVFEVIKALRYENPESRVSVLDVGCTVCEHWDLLDQLIRLGVHSECGAKDWLAWHGFDVSPLVLLAATLTHSNLSKDEFKVDLCEGSSIQVDEDSYDISLCIGVMHNFNDPIEGLKNLIRSAKIATVIALWVGDIAQGVWLISHHSSPFFLFGKGDLELFVREFPEKSFLVSDFIPEKLSTQNRHFVNLDQKSLDSIGSYHIIVTTRPDLFPNYPVLDFGVEH